LSKIQVRRGTSSQWTTANTLLSSGEIGFETDTNKFKIGDGTLLWDALEYFLDSSELSLYLTTASASTTYATKAELENIDALPSQTGNSGKYLTTDGTNPSWETVSGGTTSSSDILKAQLFFGGAN
jgi:hypothetical protein